jgi:hypothetical protein
MKDSLIALFLVPSLAFSQTPPIIANPASSPSYKDSISQKIKTSISNDSLSDRNSYQVWLDAGVYPFGGAFHNGDFYPTSNIRLGVGKSFHMYQLYCFIEFTSHKYDPPDVNSLSSLSSGKRNDIAVYAMGSIHKILYVGAGMYYSHQDNIIGHDQFGNIISESGDLSHLRLYYLIGLGYQIAISNSISLPVGLYCRNQEYSEFSSAIHIISLRLGIMYTL